MTLEEFLAWEAFQVERREFVRGEVFAMVGARRVHGLVVMNLGRLLGNALLGSPDALYRRLPSLREYLLVDPDTRRVEAFRAAPVGWVLDDMSDGTVIRLDSLGLELSSAEVFDGLATDGR